MAKNQTLKGHLNIKRTIPNIKRSIVGIMRTQKKDYA